MHLCIFLLLIETVLSSKGQRTQKCKVAEEHEKVFGRYSKCDINEGAFNDDSASYEKLLGKHFADVYNMTVSNSLRRTVCAMNDEIRVKQGCDFKYRQVNLGKDRNADLRWLADQIKKDLQKAQKIGGITYFNIGCIGGSTLKCAFTFTPNEDKKKGKPQEASGRKNQREGRVSQPGRRPASPADPPEKGQSSGRRSSVVSSEKRGEGIQNPSGGPPQEREDELSPSHGSRGDGESLEQSRIANSPEKTGTELRLPGDPSIEGKAELSSPGGSQKEREQQQQQFTDTESQDPLLKMQKLSGPGLDEEEARGESLATNNRGGSLPTSDLDGSLGES